MLQSSLEGSCVLALHGIQVSNSQFFYEGGGKNEMAFVLGQSTFTEECSFYRGNLVSKLEQEFYCVVLFCTLMRVFVVCGGNKETELVDSHSNFSNELVCPHLKAKVLELVLCG